MSLTYEDRKTLANMIAEEVECIISASSRVGRWLTFREAMEYAKVKSPTTMRKWIDEGYVYAYRLTRLLRAHSQITAEDVKCIRLTI